MDQEAHADNHPSSGDDDGSHHGKKRKLTEGSTSNQIGMGQPLSSLRKPDLPELSLTSARPPSREAGLSEDIHAPSSQEWQTIENGRPTKKAKKTPKPNSAHYPEIKFSSTSRLQSQIKITDLQSLVLYILADGPSPQFVSVRHRNEIRKVVVLMVPGLEESMFFGGKKDANKTNYSPDDFYPQKLNLDKLPSTLQPFANIFEHLWPVKTPGDDKYGKMHSPFHAMLTAALPKSKEEKKGKGAQRAQEPAGWKNVRTRITEFIHTADELLENDYTLHPAVYDDEDSKIALISHRQSNEVSQDDGWVDTLIKDFDEGSVPEDQIEQGSLTAGREILAMDCEMCMTGENDFSLTRISIVSWDGSVVLDELVKPAKAITDYVTQ
jgi:RNA exonuclease 1